MPARVASRAECGQELLNVASVGPSHLRPPSPDLQMAITPTCPFLELPLVTAVTTRPGQCASIPAPGESANACSPGADRGGRLDTVVAPLWRTTTRKSGTGAVAGHRPKTAATPPGTLAIALGMPFRIVATVRIVSA